MNKNYIVIDPVLDEFNNEKQFSENKDFYMKNTLSGIPIQFLSGDTANSSAVDLVDVIIGNDLKGIADGLGTPSEQDDQVFKYLVKTRNLIEQNPSMIEKVQNPKQALEMYDYAIKYWNTDKRVEALDKLAKIEEELIAKGNILLGVDLDNDWQHDEQYSGVESEDPDYSYNYIQISGLGAKREKKETKPGGFFKKVATGVKKGLKTAVTSVVKYNPLSIAARNGLLLALKINMFQMAEKLKFGYLTQEQAQAKGLDIAEWNKVKDALSKVENLFVKTLKGKPENIKEAIMSGKRKGFAGIGEPVSATAGTAAASGFIAKITSWLKNINFKGMLAKSPDKEQYKELYEKENGTTKGWQKAYKQTKASKSTPTKKSKGASTAPPPTDSQDETATDKSEDNADDTSADTDKSDTSKKNNKDGFFTKVGKWVKANKAMSVVSGLILAGGISLAVSPSLREHVGLQKKQPMPTEKKAITETKTLSGLKKRKRKKYSSIKLS